MPVDFWIILGIGIVLTLGISSLGAIASRKFQFNYAVLSIVSLILYLGISAWATHSVNATAGITICGLLGLLDATAGLKIAQVLKPYLGKMDDELAQEFLKEKELDPGLVIGLLAFSLFIGWIGTWFSNVIG